jgi:hypothetical protein
VLNPAPVELLAPVLNQLFEVREIGAIAPIIVGKLRSEASTREPLTKIIQDRLRDVDSEGFFAHLDHLITRNQWREAGTQRDDAAGSLLIRIGEVARLSGRRLLKRPPGRRSVGAD